MKDSAAKPNKMNQKGHKQARKSAKKRQSAYLKHFTVAVFGDAKVGKTTLIKAFLEEDFDDRYEPTIEDFYSKQVIHDEKNYQFDLIDTCGTENFPAMRRVDIEKADAVILVYSLDRANSFEYLKELREEVLRERGHSFPVIVVANKSDVVLDGHALEITDKDGVQFNTKTVTEKDWKYLWTLTSAKLQWGVQECFHELLDQANVSRRNLSLPVKRKDTWLNTHFSSLRRKSK